MSTSHVSAATTALLNRVLNPNDPATEPGRRLIVTALRLLTGGEPITVDRLTDTAGVPDPDLSGVIAGRDIEYDNEGRIVGWGLTLNPTPHRYTVNGHRLYAYCAPDTLIFPKIIGAPAKIESVSPSGTPIRLTIDPDAGITAIEPDTAVVTLVAADHVDTQRVRATLCNPQRFFATADAATDWQASNPGMIIASVADAYRDHALPIAQAFLADD